MRVAVAPESEALLASLELFGIRLGLERTRRLLASLGNPHLDLPSVLIAGTNGKGSTAALLNSICCAAGYRIGLYTSPHLESVTERVVVDGQPIEDRRLAAYLGELIDKARDESGPPTYFEALTISAFQHFHERGVDLAILEVGLGGRLDATNVSEPILSLISSISFDHQEHLGSTLTAITCEKCGILRRGRPVIAWGGHPEVEAALASEAKRTGSALTLANRQVRRQLPGATAGDCQRVELALEDPTRVYSLELGLAGRHQVENAVLAVLAAETLAAKGWTRLGHEAIRDGCRSCRWPGRLETLELANGGGVLLDAAHNPDAFMALAAHVKTLPEPPDLLFGAMRDKALGEMLPVIAAVCRHVTLTRASGARPVDPLHLASMLPDGEATIEADLSTALDHSLQIHPRRATLVCGSVALVGEARALLKEHGARST